MLQCLRFRIFIWALTKYLHIMASFKAAAMQDGLLKYDHLTPCLVVM